jgi:hypothetical protein
MRWVLPCCSLSLSPTHQVARRYYLEVATGSPGDGSIGPDLHGALRVGALRPNLADWQQQ